LREALIEAPVQPNISASKAWLRALELTAPIPRNPARILPTVIEELAEKSGDKPALLSDRESLTYRELARRVNKYSRWALDRGIAKGDVVGLLMTNRPEYFAIWLGIVSVGGVVALLNTNLSGGSLAHCVNVVTPKHVIVANEFIDSLNTALPDLTGWPAIWVHGADHAQFEQIDHNVQQYSGEKLDGSERRLVSVTDRALYIYTSGTTGLPKAANISHARVMQWGHWFAGMMGIVPEDRMYSCLPMYHSVGGVQVPGAVLVGGGSIVIREKFSASQFWGDVVRWDCTLFQYIGELCRYLLHAKTSASSAIEHRIRMACGNGLAPEIWETFKTRFSIPHIFEFYASTEGGVSLFNVEGKSGAIGHIPGYLSHRFAPALVKFDIEQGEPARNEHGFCMRCGINETGEAIGKVVEDPSGIGSRFEGYTDERSSDKKTLRNVFKAGDAWVRTGDLMRKDEHGFFYFVDRIGDTFRWKGENVSTSEVSDAIAAFPGVKHVNVYGVSIPATEGRIGMAAIVTDYALNLAELRMHLMDRLPPYARPAFLRIREDVELTGTFKYSKTDLVRDGYNPVAITDTIYFDNPESQAFHRLDSALFHRIQTGQIRL
jgi:fatty-acyl-CoA synthase